jgi:hypothetical protein
MVSSALYAAERLSNAVWISHAINLVIIGELFPPTRQPSRFTAFLEAYFLADDVAYVWWYDYQGAIQSHGINFVQDLPYFLVLLLCFQRFSSEDWGIIPDFHPRGEHCEFTFSLSTNSRATITVGAKEKLHGRYSLVGRATQVFAAHSKSSCPGETGEDLQGKDLAAKASWPEESRASEQEIIRAAQQIGATCDEVKGHLPELICSHDLPRFSTALIRESLGIAREGSRTLRILLFRRLYPITELVGEKFWKAFWECFVCKFFSLLPLRLTDILQCQAITAFGLAV